ncbi:MAG TPA: outer membrane beta-barrel protein, partial [Saprospiraceae bacterium]|nr:outer membrane beta-barrel protein [Saprospiraceae bacterium]
GYLPLQMHLPASANEVNDVGMVRIKPITNELLEVVVKAAKATLSIRGDTIEYDASSFKVPPGSTVEDMLRRLPGIDVDAEGNIKAQGKDVKRVYVDGKTFFGDDPKAATKNLGAETISKVQVYNESSEQSKLTGVDDGKDQKAMNLELKEEYKKGAFGKITGAVGNEERWAARGNYNRFNTKEQFSVIAYGNNINQTGVNWEDYGEFKGQNTFGDFDNGDFGFGGGRAFYIGGDDSDVPFNNFDGRGFTENFGSGVNYNFDNKKSKFNASYFYNQTELTLNQTAFRQTFLQDSTFTNTDTTSRLDFRSNHSISTRFEQELDSNDVLIVKANTRFSHNDATYMQSQFFTDNSDRPSNNLLIDNGTLLDSWRLSGSAIFRHRFKKKGRSIAASAGYNSSKSDGTENLFSLNRFFTATTITEQIRQLNDNDNTGRQIKSSLLFTEPFSKKWYWETFYNFARADNEVNRQVADPELNNERIESLSVFYDNKVLYNRLGSSIRYSNKGLNATAGIAAQHLQLDGSYSIDRDLPLITDPIQRSFLNYTPHVDINYEFPSNLWLSGDYSYEITEPQLNDLQPVPNVSNPAFRIEGNPNLGPQRSHNVGMNLNYWNAASMSNVGIGSNINLYDSQIVYNQTIEQIDTIGIRTTTRPDNVSGGNNFNLYLWSNFPIVKTKLTMSINGNINVGKSPSLVNGVENETFNNGFNIRTGFNLTPSPKLILGLNGNLRFNNITYSIQESQNQRIMNHGVDASVKWQFWSKFFFESNFNYAIYRNDRYAFNQDIPTWNASVRRLFGKQNRLEMRFAAFDIFNRRVSITQSGTQNYVIRNIADTLARYFMLSASYNMRGYENKINKNQWW